MTRPWTRRLAILALAGALVCLYAGVRLPIIELKRFFVFEDGYSILSMIATLADGGEWLLALIVGLFAIVFPLAKIAALGVVLTRFVSPERKALIARLVDALGKWSMLDVLVVAVLIVAVKITGLQKAATQPGLYLFVASIALTFLASRFARRLL